MARSEADPGDVRRADVLHDDGHHRLTLFRAPGGGTDAVVCFEPGRDHMKGYDTPTCPRFAQRHGIDAIMVQTARRDWFISAGSAGLAAALTTVTAGYAQVIGTGFSMGGYGALLYSGAARLTRALLVSPQYSIDPAIAPYDRGRHRKFAQIGQPMPRPEAWGNPDIAGALLYDPTIAADRAHATRIVAAFPGLSRIALPHGGHPASSVIGEAGGVGQMATMLIKDRLDAARIRQMHRAARIKSMRYRLNLAQTAIPRHPGCAIRLLPDVAAKGLPPQRLDAALALLTLHHDTGVQALCQLLDDVPAPPRKWLSRINQALAATQG